MVLKFLWKLDVHILLDITWIDITEDYLTARLRGINVRAFFSAGYRFPVESVL